MTWFQLTLAYLAVGFLLAEGCVRSERIRERAGHGASRLRLGSYTVIFLLWGALVPLAIVRLATRR